MPHSLNLIHMPDGSVVNETNHDPAKSRVTGYQRYWIGADLGQANDFSAISVIRDTCLPTVINNRVQLGVRKRVVVYADQFRGVSYVDVVDHLIRLKNAQPFGGKSQLVIDGTSIGRVVSDMLQAENVPHTAIQMTAGQNWSRKGRYVNASKTLMIENTAVLFAAGELTFAHDLPLRKEIEQDLASFSLTTTAAGNQVITQSRNASGHGDLGISLIVAAFASQYLRPQKIETAPLQNYF